MECVIKNCANIKNQKDFLTRSCADKVAIKIFKRRAFIRFEKHYYSFPVPRFINVVCLFKALYIRMTYHILSRPKRTRIPVKHSVARYTSAFMQLHATTYPSNPSVLRALSRRPLRENGARVLSVAQHFPAFPL